MDTANLTDTQDLTLVWDMVGNLTSRRDQGAARDTTETYTYDALNRLRTVSLNGTQSDSVTYDAFGNFKTKTGIGTYSYLGTQPHAVTATTTGSKSYTYDANGNMMTGSGRTLSYPTFDKPSLISQGTTSAAFRYGPDREVYKRVDTVSGVATTTWYVGSSEVVVKSDNSSDIRRYLDGVAEQVLHKNSSGTLTGTDTRYLLRDHLGSVTGFMNATVIDQEQAFDAWGRRENVGWASYMTVGGTTWNAIMGLTERGFTGHQHVDRLDLIHMNGRTYDPKVGRFMQADLFVQDPADTQSYNRYSYARNNPLNATDPTGFLFSELVRVVRDVAYIVYGDGWADPNAWIQLGADLYALAGEFGSGGGAGSASAPGAFGSSSWSMSFNGNSSGPQTAGTGGADPGPIIDNGPRSIDPRVLVALEIERATTGQTISQASGGKFANGGASQTFDLSLARHPYIAEEEEDEDNYISAHVWLNGASMALDATGIGAVVSWIPDVLDAGLSAYEGDWTGVGLSAISVVPGIGNLGNTAKLARLGAKSARRVAGTGTHAVYQGIDKTNVVRYVGITSRDVLTRSAEHIASGAGKQNLIYRAVQGGESLTLRDARVMEQQLINQFGLGKHGGQLLNKINSISPKHWDTYGIAP